MKLNNIMLLGRMISVIACAAVLGCGGGPATSLNQNSLQSGSILFADPYNGRLVNMDDLSGAGWQSFENGYMAPIDVSVAPDGHMIWLDHAKQKIMRSRDMSGLNYRERLLRDITPPVGWGTIFPPLRIAVGLANEIYILTRNGPVYTLEDFLSTTADVIPGTDDGVDIEVGPSGCVYILFKTKLAKYDPYTGTLEYLPSNIPGHPNLNNMMCLAIDAQERIYVSTGTRSESPPRRTIRIDDISGTNWIEAAFGGQSMAIDKDGTMMFWLGNEIRAYESFASVDYWSFGAEGEGKYQLTDQATIHIVP